MRFFFFFSKQYFGMAHSINATRWVVSSLQTSPRPSHLTRPHPHAVRHKVIIIINCRLVPYGITSESDGLKLGIQTSLFQTHRQTHNTPRKALHQLRYQDRHETEMSLFFLLKIFTTRIDTKFKWSAHILIALNKQQNLVFTDVPTLGIRMGKISTFWG